MKQFIVLVCLVTMVLGVSTAVFAGQKNYGCGLGSMVFGESNDGLVSQTFAGTTNGTSYSQFFGITSGTSNCEQFKTFASNENLVKFVENNMDNLAADIAKGHGEYLNTLAVLINIPEMERSGFYAKLQTNFSNIYTSKDITHMEVIQHIESVVTLG